MESLNFTQDYLISVVHTLYYLNALAACIFLILTTVSSTLNSDDINIVIIMIFFTSVYFIVSLFDIILGRENTGKILKYCTTRRTVSNGYYIILSVCAVGVFICGILLAIESNENKLPVTFSTSKNALELSMKLNSPVCDGHKYHEYTPWMDCLKETHNCQTSECVLYKNKPENFLPPITNDTNGQPQNVLPKLETKVFGHGMYVWWGTAVLCFISFIFHFIQMISSDDVRINQINKINGVARFYKSLVVISLTRWTFSTEYILWINDSIQPMRWLEYSISSPLLFILLFVINKVHDIQIITFTAIILIMVTSFGAAIDYTDRVPIIIWFCILGVIALIWQFVLLSNSYTDNISIYYNGDASGLWEDAYGFILFANWSVCLGYVLGGTLLIINQCRRFDRCFTTVQTVNKDRQRCCCCFVKNELPADQRCIQTYQHEIIYIIFSIIVKSFFVFVTVDRSI